MGRRATSICIVISISICVASTAFAQAAIPPSPLERILQFQPFVRCFALADGSTVISSSPRGDAAGSTRELMVGGEPRQVSVLRGARLIYADAAHVPFARVMVEQSDWNRYADDVDTLVRVLSDIAVNTGMVMASYQVGEVSGGNVSDFKAKGYTRGMTHLYFDVDRTVVTIYYMNAPAGDKRYAALQDFSAARVQFESSFVSCVVAARSEWKLPSQDAITLKKGG